MFKTVKSKIIAITLFLLFVLSALAGFIALKVYEDGKKFKTKSCDLQVSYFSEDANKSVQYFEEKVSDLAFSGEIFYNSDKLKPELSDYIVKKTFLPQSRAIGGGLWFEPFKVYPKKEKFCSYVFHKSGKMILDPNCGADVYNYLEKPWYKAIKRELIKGEKVVWVTPYLDQAGSKAYMTTAGAGIYDKRGNLVGIATVDWSLDTVIKKIYELKPTKNSYVLFADEKNDVILASDFPEHYEGKHLSQLKWYNPNLKNGQIFIYNNVRYVTFKRILDNKIVLIVNVPERELYGDISKNFELTIIFFAICFLFITSAVYELLIHNINKPIDKLKQIAQQIGSGNLDVEADLDTPEEFAQLAQTFNKMTKDIKQYIDELGAASTQKKQMQFELSTAKAIQNSVLPSVFPPYPEHKEFDIYASMTSAKEIGGDFYDFFFVDSEKFAFLTADVSGKGVPSALFMMNAKTLIKNLAKTGIPPEKIMEKANRMLCENNEQGFFVTAFLCILELSTGRVQYVSAGHNPALKSALNSYELMECDTNFILGGLPQITYKKGETILLPGESIFLYTDGVTEALNPEGKFYSEENMLKAVNECKSSSPQELINCLEKDIKDFRHGEELSDDITMLALRYNGTHDITKHEENLKIEADLNNLYLLTNTVERLAQKAGLSEEQKMKLTVSAEELFVNIENYAFRDLEDEALDRTVDITVCINDIEAKLIFKDKGTPYNPFAAPDPDITLSPKQRPIGGLGVFMVKKLTDFVDYDYENGQNIVIVKLKLN